MNDYLSPLWISLKNGACDHRNYLCSGNRSGALDVPIYRKDKTDNRRDIHFATGITPTVVGFGLLLFMGKHGWGGKFLALFNTSIVFSWPATVIAAAVMFVSVNVHDNQRRV